MMEFSLEMAIVPGLSENTVVGQLTKALTYWQANSTLPNASLAITWIQTELTRVSNPPKDAYYIVNPV